MKEVKKFKEGTAELKKGSKKSEKKGGTEKKMVKTKKK